jgi:FKBP-type peptidyl-prolyl cis-trans isomerase
VRVDRSFWALAPIVAGLAIGACADTAPPEGFLGEMGIDTARIGASETGLYVKQVKEGSGAPAEVGDAINILYTGWLTDGTEFDSSYKSDPPRTFPVVVGGGGAIPGFMEGTEGMREGEKRHLVIPPALGYGAAGAGGVIPPNATLVFEVEAERIERSADPRDVDFDASLGIDLEAMMRSPTGLYWTTLQEGSGAETKPGDALSLHYTGWLADGTKFDSSFDRTPPAPLEMVLGQTALIEGWTEGVTGMRLGEKRRLVIPPILGYGLQNRGLIMPNSVLVFEVELMTHDPAG